MNGPIRILTIGHSYVISANRAIIREVARDPEFRVTVGAPTFFRGDLSDLTLEAEPEGSPLRVEGLRSRWSGRIHAFHYKAADLRRIVAGEAFDLVHSWAEPYVYSGYQVARLMAGRPTPFCFWTAQNLEKRMPPPFSYFERKTLARAQGWIACGELVREAMVARGYPEGRGKVLPLAVDTANFRPFDDARRSAAQANLGLRSPVIGYMGRLTEEKGIRTIFRAMERIGGDRPWSLLFVGGGPLEREILDWAGARGWGDRVRIALARHGEVPDYLGAMDLLLAPSRTTPQWKEQLGRMLIEAFACGVPVIGSDSGEIPFVIGDAGKVIPEADEEGWARAIGELLDHPALRHDLGRRGLGRCEAFSVRSVARQYRDYYRWLAGQPVP